MRTRTLLHSTVQYGTVAVWCYHSALFTKLFATPSRGEKASASEVLASIRSVLKGIKARYFRCYDASANEIVDLCRKLAATSSGIINAADP